MPGEVRTTKEVMSLWWFTWLELKGRTCVTWRRRWSQQGRPAVTSSNGFWLGQRARQVERLVVPRGSIVVEHSGRCPPPLLNETDERRKMFPAKACDVEQLEGHADDIWATCDPPAPPGPFLLRLQGIASRCPQGRIKPRQCPAAGHGCWTWLIRATRWSQKRSLSLKTQRRPQAGGGQTGQIRPSPAWQGVLAPSCPGKAPGAPARLPATTGR